MAQTGETEVVAGNVRDMINRLSRDMTNRNPFTVADKKVLSHSPTQQYVAVFAYNATQADEISFGVGDTIELITEVEDGWSRGKLLSTGATGMYPTNFVQPKQPLPAPTSTNFSGAKTVGAAAGVVMRPEPKAIERTPSTVLSDHAPKVSQFAHSDSKPIHHVSDPAASVSTESSDVYKTKEMARVKFVYTPNHPDELALSELDTLITIISKDCGDAGWFEGELNGKKGVFPDNFIEIVRVPINTESGKKYANVTRPVASSVAINKPPPANPPQPAVPPKPTKIKADSVSPNIVTTTSSTAPSTTSSAVKNDNFAALRAKMHNNLVVVAPENRPTIQQKHLEQRERAGSVEGMRQENEEGENGNDVNSSGDQVPELHHITKGRARPPKNRPMSMVMNRNRLSDESPNGRLSSPTSSATNQMSTSMFAPVFPKEVPDTSSPFKPKVLPTVVPPSSASKPALRPVVSNAFVDVPVVSKEITIESSTSEFVTRAEYDALLERVRILESRLSHFDKMRL